MKLNSFFKILNRKINKYDRVATNPFTDPRRMIIVWVEDDAISDANEMRSNEVNSDSDN